VTPTGINQREADVAQTFHRAIDAIIALEPDMVVIAGDFFHVVRPSNPAILHAFSELARLVKALREVQVVIVAGNHDLPRTSDAGCILQLFGRLDRVDVAAFKQERFHYAHLGASVLAVPHTLGSPELSVDQSARYNILVRHCETTGTAPAYLSAEDRAQREIPVEELTMHPWDYVALGEYHVYRKVADNVFYSGSIDYTSVNPWGELFEERDWKVPGKGFIERNLATGAHRFHPIEPARPVLDLPAINAAGLSAAELDDAIRRTVGAIKGGVDDKIVRLVIKDVPRHVVREMDHRMLRDLRQRALHFHLDTRKPEIVRRDASGGPGRRASLAELVKDHLAARSLPDDISREELVSLGLDYLRQAEQIDATPAMAGSDLSS
jgi:DNA repair protein SbcD/Mre11